MAAIGVNWKEVWKPVWKAVWTQVPPIPPAPEEERTGGHAYLNDGDRFAKARKRLALQRLIGFLTQKNPPPETKRIVRAIKAGKPIQPDPKAPTVMAEPSAEKIAAALIPERIEEVKKAQAAGLEVQELILKAIAIAEREREQDDEEVLMLL